MTFNALVPELYVTDLERSLAFYIQLLGFEVAYDRPEEGFAFLRLGGAQLMLEQTHALTPSTPDEVEGGVWRTGALVHPFGRGINFSLAVAALAPIVKRLEEGHYPLVLAPQERWHRVGGQLMGSVRCLVLDPDGYLFRLEMSLGEKSLTP